MRAIPGMRAGAVGVRAGAVIVRAGAARLRAGAGVVLRELRAAEIELMGSLRPTPREAWNAAGFHPCRVGEWCLGCGRSIEPPLPHDPRCESCLLEDPALRGDPWPLARLGRYQGDLREWILEIKHHRWESMGEFLGRILAAQWRCTIALRRRRWDLDWVAVPMGMPAARRRERGIDHAAVIARALARGLRLPRRRLLSHAAGATQAHLGASERRGRGGRFEVRNSRWRALCGLGTALPAAVILVDDVRTSGATLREAAETLRSAGVRRVAAAVLAVSHDDLRG